MVDQRRERSTGGCVEAYGFLKKVMRSMDMLITHATFKSGRSDAYSKAVDPALQTIRGCQ